MRLTRVRASHSASGRKLRRYSGSSARELPESDSHVLHMPPPNTNTVAKSYRWLLGGSTCGRGLPLESSEILIAATDNS